MRMWYLFGALLIATGIVVLVAGVRRARRPRVVALSGQALAEFAAGIAGPCRYCGENATGRVRAWHRSEYILYCDRHIGHAAAQASAR